MDKLLRERLKEAKLRATPHRIRVLAALEDAGRPLSHTEILQKLAEIKLDRVTLYRVLASLTEAQIVHQVQGSDSVWRFCFHDKDSNQCPGGHAHILCEKCGIMRCLHNSRLPHVAVPEHFQVHHKQMLITGICPECAGKSDSNTQ